MARQTTIEVIAQFIDKLTGPVKNAEKSTKSSFANMSKGTNGLTKAVTGLVAAYGGMVIVGKVNALMKESVELYKRQENANQKLRAVLQSTGNAAGMTYEELKRLSLGLQSFTTFGDEAIDEANAILLTFTKIGRDVFPKATETVLDMSAALGQDLKSSAIQLGKALNDPITGAAALRRVGVSLTEQQMEQIKTLQQQNKLYEAQKIIVDELAVEFGGMARALAETDVGKLEQMENQLGDIKELLGKEVIPWQVKWNETILETAQYWSKVFGLAEDARTFTDVRQDLKLANQMLDLRKQDVDEQRKKNDNSKAFYKAEERYFAALKYRNKIEAEYNQLIESRKPSNQPGAKAGGGKTPSSSGGGGGGGGGGSSGGGGVMPAGFLTMEQANGQVDIVTDMAKQMQSVELTIASETAKKKEEQQRAELERLNERYDAEVEILKEAWERKREVDEEGKAERERLAQEEYANIESFAQSFGSNMAQIFTDLVQVQINSIEKQRKKEIEAVKASGKTAKEKQKQIEEINKKAEEEQRRMANVNKVIAVGETIISTAQGIANALTMSPPPLGIAMAAIVGAMGAAQIALIASQSFAHGGVVQGPEAGDNVLVRANGGEMVLTQAQQARLLAMAEGQAGSNSPSVTNSISVSITGNVDDETWAERMRALVNELDELAYSRG